MNFSSGDYWLLLGQAGTETKIIFIIFGLMSFACAIIVAMKLMSLRSKLRVAKLALQNISTARSIDDILALSKKYESTGVGVLLNQYLIGLKNITQEDSFEFSEVQYNQLQDMLDQVTEDIMFHEERYMSAVSTSAAISPLIGLFGTVSGLIHAFIKIAQVKSADIAAIAPGIAEALMTTWGGLIIAISFLGLFYVVQGRIRGFEHQLLKISDRLMWFARSVTRG